MLFLCSKLQRSCGIWTYRANRARTLCSELVGSTPRSGWLIPAHTTEGQPEDDRSDGREGRGRYAARLDLPEGLR
jgi:hypothetical protein